MIPLGSIHIFRETERGPECFCGRDAVIGVYPSELNEYSSEAICASCTRLHTETLRIEADSRPSDAGTTAPRPDPII